jgi:hypothetical protein
MSWSRVRFNDTNSRSSRVAAWIYIFYRWPRSCISNRGESVIRHNAEANVIALLPTREHRASRCGVHGYLLPNAHQSVGCCLVRMCLRALVVSRRVRQHPGESLALLGAVCIACTCSSPGHAIPSWRMPERLKVVAEDLSSQSEMMLCAICRQRLDIAGLLEYGMKGIE